MRSNNDTWSVDHYEIGAGDHFENGNVEIGEAVRQVIKTARDNRQPAPKMRAVSLETPLDDASFVLEDWFTDVLVGTGSMIGVVNPFPMMTKFLQRFGAGLERPRYVRVDTEESYAAFCAENSPEMASYQDSLRELSDRLEDHIQDPVAHEDLLDAIDEAEEIGAQARDAQLEKMIDLWLPDWAKGKVHAWKEGGFICASIHLPGSDGEIRICTSMTPVVKAIEEMEHHAADANVSAAAVIGVLPAMGCVLGAGTLVKEMAAAAPSILQRPEAAKSQPFVCRIEPKASPALCAFIALAQECAKGDKQACAEWNALANAAGKGAPYAKQAMIEAKGLFSKALKK